jgi:hypothetical protein
MERAPFFFTIPHSAGLFDQNQQFRIPNVKRSFQNGILKEPLYGVVFLQGGELDRDEA